MVDLVGLKWFDVTVWMDVTSDLRAVCIRGTRIRGSKYIRVDNDFNYD